MKRQFHLLVSHKAASVLQHKALAVVARCEQGQALTVAIGNQYFNVDKQVENLRKLCSGDEVLIEPVNGCNIITALLSPRSKSSLPTFIEERPGTWSLQLGLATIRMDSKGSIHLITPKAFIELNSEGLCLMNAEMQEIKGRLIKLN
jgi:hypothetical protein